MNIKEKKNKEIKTIKVAINAKYGGFSLSEEAYLYMGIPWDKYGFHFSHGKSIERADERLIECIEAIGEKANGRSAKIKIVEIPSDVEFEIAEYDGYESIHEVHRSWS